VLPAGVVDVCTTRAFDDGDFCLSLPPIASENQRRSFRLFRFNGAPGKLPECLNPILGGLGALASPSMPLPISLAGSSAPPQLNAVMASSFVRDKFTWLRQVRVDPDLTPLAFMLAYVLAEFVNEGKGCAWPGIARLAAECRVTERGIKKVIRRLVERGHLHVEVAVGRGRTNRYRWIIKRADSRGIAGGSRSGEERETCLNSEFDKPLPSISGRKRGTGVPLFVTEKGTCGSEKGELTFQKRGSPVPPTLFIDSIYDPPERVSAPPESQITAAGFDDVWRAYPKKVAREEALRVFVKASKSAPIQDIVLGAMRYAAERTGQDPRYTKHPTTWLSKACWTDPPRPSRETLLGPGEAAGRFYGSVVERMHTNADFEEIVKKMQTQRKGGT